jgi:hydroxymethylpyrimidine pyrophosphatase-like HAD family hydrolase
MRDGARSTYLLIALDVDGTLLDPAGHVSPRTRAAVREALARGVAVVLCTGRVFSQGIRHLSEELGLSLPAIVRNGAAIQDTATGRVLFNRAIPAGAVRAALDVMLAGETVPVVEEGPGRGDELVTLRGATSNPAVRYFARTWLRQDSFRFVAEGAELYAVREPTFVCAFGTRERTEPVYRALGALPGTKLYWTGDGRFDRPLSPEHYCAGISPGDCSKATALAAFAAERGLGMEAVMAVGDFYNDVEMLAEAGLGVAMGHAPEGVRRVAKAVVPDNANDGAAVAIERYVLGTEELARVPR